MNIPNCIKGLLNCEKNNCPMFPCWAYDEYQQKNKKRKDYSWK